MSLKQLFKNPYLYSRKDFEKREKTDTYHDLPTLTDCSGYLCLRDQINIIKSHSALNNEFRRGQIDRFNEDKKVIINQLSSFEEDEFVVDQLHKARTGDLIDKTTIYKQAYNLGRQSGFFQHNSEAVKEPDHTLGDGAEKKQSETVSE